MGTVKYVIPKRLVCWACRGTGCGTDVFHGKTMRRPVCRGRRTTGNGR